MKYLTKTILMMFLLTVIVGCSATKAQKNTTEEQNKFSSIVEGLTNVKIADLEGFTLPLDGESIPYYSIEGERIQGAEIMSYLTNQAFNLEPYVDSENNVQVLVFRPATEEELQKKQEATKEKEEVHPLKGKEGLPFEVTDINGMDYSLESLKGKIVVVNFWFTACAPCRKEIPELNKLVEKYTDQEVVFLAFAKDDTKNIQTFLEKQVFNYSIIPNANEFVKQYEIQAFPTNLIIDQSSKIVFVTESYSSETVDAIDENVEVLLKQ